MPLGKIIQRNKTRCDDNIKIYFQWKSHEYVKQTEMADVRATVYFCRFRDVLNHLNLFLGQ